MINRAATICKLCCCQCCYLMLVVGSKCKLFTVVGPLRTPLLSVFLVVYDGIIGMVGPIWDVDDC